MTSQKNSIWKNLAARRALFLTPVHFLSPNLPLHHLNIPLKTAVFFPEVFLIKNTFEKCTSLGAFGLHLCTYTSLSLGIPAMSMSVSPITRSCFLREQYKILLKQTICRREAWFLGAAHHTRTSDLVSSSLQLFQAADRARWWSCLSLSGGYIHLCLSFRDATRQKLLTPVMPPWKNSS